MFPPVVSGPGSVCATCLHRVGPLLTQSPCKKQHAASIPQLLYPVVETLAAIRAESWISDSITWLTTRGGSRTGWGTNHPRGSWFMWPESKSGQGKLMDFSLDLTKHIQFHFDFAIVGLTIFYILGLWKKRLLTVKARIAQRLFVGYFQCSFTRLSQDCGSTPGRRQRGRLTSTRCIGFLASIAASLLTCYYRPQVMDTDINSGTPTPT